MRTWGSEMDPRLPPGEERGVVTGEGLGRFLSSNPSS